MSWRIDVGPCLAKDLRAALERAADDRKIDPVLAAPAIKAACDLAKGRLGNVVASIHGAVLELEAGGAIQRVSVSVDEHP